MSSRLRMLIKTRVLKRSPFALSLKRGSGFVLIEVLIAVIILSTSLVLIIQSLGQSAQVSSCSGDYVPAVILLENKLTALWGQSGNTNEQDHFLKPFDKYYYQLSTAVISTENKGSIAQADLSIDWLSGNTPKKLSVQTYFLLPPDDQN